MCGCEQSGVGTGAMDVAVWALGQWVLDLCSDRLVARCKEHELDRLGTLSLELRTGQRE